MSVTCRQSYFVFHKIYRAAGKEEYPNILGNEMPAFNIEIIFPEVILENSKPSREIPCEKIEKYFKRWCPELCCFRKDDDCERILPNPIGSFPINKIENRKLWKVKLNKGSTVDCSVLLLDESDIDSISYRIKDERPRCLREKAVVVIVSGHSTEISVERLVSKVGQSWKGIVIRDPSSLKVLRNVRQAVLQLAEKKTADSKRASELKEWLDNRRHQNICFAGRGRRTVKKVKELLDDFLREHEDIKTEELRITSSVIREDLSSVTHVICCVERSERNILFSAIEEPDELTLSVNHFEKARKRTLIIEYGGEDPAEDQLYDAKVFNDSMKRGQPRLKDFIDKDCFISLSEVLNGKQKHAITCWLGREEEKEEKEEREEREGKEKMKEREEKERKKREERKEREEKKEKEEKAENQTVVPQTQQELLD